MITVKLILNEHFPEKHGVWNEEDFSAVQVISLANKKIKEIENLDLFDNITQVHLQHNEIKRIENVGHLLHLHSLDLSHNFIDEEGLHAERLPPNLKSLYLEGNPCVASTSAMEKLQREYPQLEVHMVSEMKGPTHPTTDSDIHIPNPAFSPAPTGTPCYMDSESVLREVVNRKCRLQALSNVNMDSTIQSLEKEYDVLTLASRNRRENQVPQMTESGEVECSVVDLTMQHAPLYQSRLDELKAKATSIIGAHPASSSASDDFFNKLRAKSFQAYDEKIKENKIAVGNVANEENPNRRS